MGLENKRVVVIGGTSGIGVATARAAAEDGATVVVASSTRDRVTWALSTLPAGCEGRVLDVGDEAGVIEFFDDIGDFDHLVHTAGRGPALEGSRSVADHLAARLAALQFVVEHSIRHIAATGSITLTSGQLSTRPQKGMATASAVASAIEGLTRALAVQFAPVRVNAVAPGIIRTAMWDVVPPDQRETLFADMGTRLLTGCVGEPEDVAEAHLFLMRSNFVTGTIVAVDGGNQLV